jgi:hypothetical protein
LGFLLAGVIQKLEKTLRRPEDHRYTKMKTPNHTVDPSAMTLRVTSVMPPAGRYANEQEPRQRQVALGHG